MIPLFAAIFGGVIVATTFRPSTDGDTNGYATYRGLCDASAVEMLDDAHFVVADDEDNILRVYNYRRGELPVRTLDLSPFLHVNPQEPEADLEGAARLGNRIYWITSHGRSRKGQERTSRQRFFATTGSVTNGVMNLRPVGVPYADLLEDLLNDSRLARFNLAAAAELAPKASGALNIEGLAPTPEGHLLLGFRNPIPHGQALIVPLLNPADLVAGQPARFGAPQLLKLDGLGIRSFTAWHGQYLIVAGSYEGAGVSRLYLWPGTDAPPQRLRDVELAGLNPEAIAVLPDELSEQLLVVSDDGNRVIGGKPCKKLKDPMQQCFRATRLPTSVLWPQISRAAEGK